jgi:F0F1-type ATP synthase assembly protein I
MTEQRRNEERRNALTEAEVAIKIAAREKAEAEAKQADERAIITTVAMGALVVVGLVVAIVGLLVKENIPIGVIGILTAAIGGAVITAKEGAKLLGRNENGGGS